MSKHEIDLSNPELSNEIIVERLIDSKNHPDKIYVLPKNCHNLFSGNQVISTQGANWDTSKTTKMEGMFYGCKKANPDVSNWDVSNVTNFAVMFEKCPIADPKVENWKVSSLQICVDMFNKTKTAKPNIENWMKYPNVKKLFKTIKDLEKSLKIK